MVQIRRSGAYKLNAVVVVAVNEIAANIAVVERKVALVGGDAKEVGDATQKQPLVGFAAGVLSPLLVVVESPVPSALVTERNKYDPGELPARCKTGRWRHLPERVSLLR